MRRNWSVIWTVLVIWCAASSARWDGEEHEIDEWRTTGQRATINGSGIRVWWTSDGQQLTFRVEAETKGFFGLGFIKHTRHSKKTDLIVGWVENGQAVIQDRHETPKREFRLDRKQNVELVVGFENKTHITLIFKRKHDTCDREEDVAITNDTSRVFYVLNTDHLFHPNSSFNISRMLKGHTSAIISPKPQDIQKLSNQWLSNSPEAVVYWDLIDYKVVTPRDEDNLQLCRVFQLPPNITTKHQVIGFEPIFSGNSRGVFQQILVYSCHPRSSNERQQLDELSDRVHFFGQYEKPSVIKTCHTLFLVWTIGSKGMALPEEAGLTLDPDVGPSYLYAEFQYDTVNLKHGGKVSQGLRLWCSPVLRPAEAGVMSVGILPNWKHTIPPRQFSINSYGHCIGKCTKQVFPSSGINVFSTIFHSHSLGRRIVLRHIRDHTELVPIAEDNFYDFNYQEIRWLSEVKTILPGDHLIAECTYNSRGRNTVTVGGLLMRDETCVVFVYYYPRVPISSCQSIPTIKTAHASLGVEEIWESHIPPLIKRPAKYANLTLAEHMSEYDWDKNIELYKNAVKSGSIETSCSNITHQSTTSLYDSHRPPEYSSYERSPMCSLPTTLSTETNTLRFSKINNTKETAIVDKKSNVEKKSKTHHLQKNSSVQTTYVHWFVCTFIFISIFNHFIV